MLDRGGNEATKGVHPEDLPKISYGSTVEPGSRDFFILACNGRNWSTVQILKHFAWSHLPEHLRPYSQNCADLALQMVARLPDGPELTTGLRKLLEAKDCFVRAALER